MEDQKQTEIVEEQPYAPPAPGSDPDSRKRELKTVMAAAETRGDTETVQDLQAALDELATAQQREVAAAARKAAADASGDPDAAHKPPAGRTATAPKATTKQADPASKGGQAGDEGKK